MNRLAIVTASLGSAGAEACIGSWWERATAPIDCYIVAQCTPGSAGWETAMADTGEMLMHAYRSPEILGVVPAFAIGVQKALDDGAQIIACLHDDLEIQQQGWDEEVVRLFKACPRAGLCGFGGGKGLGSDDIYQTPYNPMQLARQGFRSNMRDAEAHGIRSRAAEPVACLDGFSQIGLASFWRGKPHPTVSTAFPTLVHDNLLREMADWGITHHCFDSLLGCWAKRLGYQVWFLPIACHHYGGRTAVGDTRYTEWAKQQTPDGDAGFWDQAHRIGYARFKDVLPIRT